MARACLETGQPDHAFVYLRAAENSASHRGEVRRLMGLAHLRAGDIEQAVDELMAAVRSNPQDTELAVALEEALERFTQPISLEDLEGEERTAGDPARARDDEWEATRMDLIAQDGFDIATAAQPPQRDLEFLLDDAFVRRSLPAARKPAPHPLPRAAAPAPGASAPVPRVAAAEPPGTEQDAVVEPVAPVACAEDAAAGVEGAVFGSVADPEPPAEDRAQADQSVNDADPSLAEVEPRADVIQAADSAVGPDLDEALERDGAQTLHDARLEATEPDPSSPPVELAGARTTSPPQTVIQRGKSDRPSSRARRMRTTTFTAVALSGAITVGLGAVTTFRSARYATESLPQAAPSPALPPQAPVAAPEEAAPETPTAVASAAGVATADRSPRPSRSVPETPELVENEVIGAAPAAEAAPDARVLQPIQGPSYEFMKRLGLPVPPGGVLDAENSDTHMLLFDARSSPHPQSSVLTFRTTAGIEEVLAFYASSGIHGFRPRTVQMGGEFLGVERTVARASARGATGREATITISHPGVDRAARQLVPETTIRIEFF